MNIAMMRDAVMAAASRTTPTPRRRSRPRRAPSRRWPCSRGYGIFGTSPAGKSTDAVFAKASTVIDDLNTEVNQAITVLTQNLHASVDAVLRDQEVAEVDYAKLTKDNRDRVDNLGDTGIQPGDETYVAPVATDPSTAPPGTEPGTPPSTDPGADPDETGTVS